MSQLATAFLNNILPIAIAAGIGFILGKKSVIQADSLSRLALYIFTPCLVLTMLTIDPLPWGSMLIMLVYTFVLMVGISLLMGAFGWAMHWK